MPLRNLFGYRSQANFETRQLIGQSFEEFRQFFQQYSDIFLIDNTHETVVLNWSFYDSLFRQLVSRTDRFSKFSSTISKIVTNNRNHVPIRQLYDLFTKCDPFFMNCKQFSFFLCLFPEIFHVREDIVSMKTTCKTKT